LPTKTVRSELDRLRLTRFIVSGNMDVFPDFYFCFASCAAVAKRAAKLHGMIGATIVYSEHCPAGKAILDKFRWDTAPVAHVSASKGSKVVMTTIEDFSEKARYKGDIQWLKTNLATE